MKFQLEWNFSLDSNYIEYNDFDASNKFKMRNGVGLMQETSIESIGIKTVIFGEIVYHFSFCQVHGEGVLFS